MAPAGASSGSARQLSAAMKAPGLVVCRPTMATGAPRRPARLVGRLRCRARARQVEGHRLLDEDVLAGRGRLHDLRGMLAVRRRQHDRVDRRIGQDRGVAVDEPHVLLAAEGVGGGARAGMGGHETDIGTLALDRVDERTTPAAEPQYCGAYHEVLLAKVALRHGRRIRLTLRPFRLTVSAIDNRGPGITGEGAH